LRSAATCLRRRLTFSRNPPAPDDPAAGYETFPLNLDFPGLSSCYSCCVSLLTGVGASAAQNAPVTKTCSQCGAVLPSSVRACNFCDSPFSSSTSCYEEFSAYPPLPDSGQKAAPAHYSVRADGDNPPPIAAPTDQESAWRGEVSSRMEAYRARKRRRPANTTQTQLPFEDSAAPTSTRALALDEAPGAASGAQAKSLCGSQD